MKEVLENNRGSHVLSLNKDHKSILSLNTSCIGYIDDLALSAPKCAVMIYGKAMLPKPMKLGGSSIKY